MISAPVPNNEISRLRSLRQLALLDSASDARFDRLTALAAKAFDVPIAQINLIDEGRQWSKSCFGMDALEVDRTASFCAHTILGEGPLMVNDATRDPRFFDNPFVVEGPKVRFYAGFPISLGERGDKVGSLCLVDRRPRLFSEEDRKLLAQIGDLVKEEFKNRARELILQCEERLNTLLTYSESGFFDDNFSKGTCYFSPRWKEILGYGNSELSNNYETFRSLVNWNDFQEVAQCLAPRAPGVLPFSFECRMRHKNGHWIWIESRGITEADELMKPMRHLGFITDITERREETARLKLLELCFERLGEGILITDAELLPARLSILDLNPAMEALTGYTRDELIDKEPGLLMGPFQNQEALMTRVLGEHRSFAFEGESPRNGGGKLQATWTVFPLADAKGRLTHLMTTVRGAVAEELQEGKSA